MTSKKKIRRDDGTLVMKTVLNRSSALVTLEPPKGTAKPTSSQYSDDDETAEYQSWGTNNDWPRIARKKIEDSTTAYPLIAKMAGLRFGRGLVYYREKREGNQIVHEFPKIAEIDTFFQQNNIQYFMLERLMDYGVTGNVFSEFILNAKRDKIQSVYHLEAEFTRFGKLNKKTGLAEELLYNGNWDDEAEYDRVPYLNKRSLTLNNIKSQKKFAIHSCLPSPGRTLYAFPPHGALFREKGWLDFANSVPVITNNMNENAMQIKYHIKIPYDYWGKTYKDWDILDQKKRDELIDKKLTEMDEWLTGSKNAYKSFISHFAVDPIKGTKTSGWEIEVLDDKAKKDAYVTSLQEADTQISRAVGMDTSLSGIQAQGGKMGAGSGSDKRVGYINTIAMSYADQLVITEPLYLVRDVNGWGYDIKFGFLHDMPTTLNENPSGVETNQA